MNRKGSGQIKVEVSDGAPVVCRSRNLQVVLSGIGALSLIAICVVDAWFFGGIPLVCQAWLARAVFLVAIFAFLAIAASKRGQFVWPLAMWPLLAAVLLGVIQFTPLPRSWIERASPVHQDYSRDMVRLTAAKGAGELFESERLSLYPASTRQTVCLLLVGVSVFFLASQLLANSFWLLVACGIFAVHGAAFSLFGVLQQLSNDVTLLGMHLPSQGGQPFASFVNRNHAGDYLNLCLAGCIGISLWLAGRYGLLSSKQSAARHRRRASFRQFVASWNTGTLGIAAVTSLLVMGLVGSISRGATLSAVIALIVTVGVLLLHSRLCFAVWHGWLLGSGFLAVVLAFFVGSGILSARLYQLTDLQRVIAEPRLLHWRDGLRAIPDFWRAGSGLGTYRFIYQAYETRSSGAWYYHAENQYLETMVEGGVPALLLLATATATCFEPSLRVLCRASGYQDLAIGAMGLFALTSQVMHAGFDFGLYMPANMVLLATLCGGVCGYAHTLGSTCSKQWRPRWVGAATFTVIGLGLILASRELDTAAAVDSATRTAKMISRDPDTDWRNVDTSIRRLETSVNRYDGDAEAHQELGDLHVLRYRLHAYKQLQDDPRLSRQEPRTRWHMTSPLQLFRRVHEWARTQQGEVVTSLLRDSLANGELSRAVEHYTKAHSACTLLSRPLLGLAELSVLSEHFDNDAALLEGVRRRAPRDANLRFRCGMFEYYAGRFPQAYADWRICLSESTDHLETIVELARWRLDFEQLIDCVIPPQPDVLVRLGQDFFWEARYERRRLGEIAEGLLPEGDSTPTVHHLRAKARRLQFRFPEALADYHQAMILDSRDPRIRYELAGLLVELGDTSQARRHAEICANMAPNNQRYRDLVRQLASQFER